MTVDRTQMLIVIFVFVGALIAGCGGTPTLQTNTINLRCDSNFNDGLILPVDLVFIPKDEKVDSVTGISPDDWFDSEVRDSWAAKETYSVRETGIRQTITVKLKKPSGTTALVIVTDYRNLSDGRSQILVLDPDAKETEDIFITVNGLLR